MPSKILMLKAKIEFGLYLIKKYGGKEWIIKPMTEAMNQLIAMKS